MKKLLIIFSILLSTAQSETKNLSFCIDNDLSTDSINSNMSFLKIIIWDQNNKNILEFNPSFLVGLNDINQLPMIPLLMAKWKKIPTGDLILSYGLGGRLILTDLLFIEMHSVNHISDNNYFSDTRLGYGISSKVLKTPFNLNFSYITNYSKSSNNIPIKNYGYSIGLNYSLGLIQKKGGF